MTPIVYRFLARCYGKQVEGGEHWGLMSTRLPRRENRKDKFTIKPDNIGMFFLPLWDMITSEVF